MAKEIIIDIENFKKGFQDLQDTTKAPIGSLRIMKNSRVTNRGGLAPREGVTLIGTANTTASVCRGFFVYKKSFGADQFLIKGYDDEIEAYSLNHPTLGWFRVKNGFTVDKEFGFVTSLVNTLNEDYVIGCNRFDSQFRWTGAVTQLNGALAGAATVITVDSTLNSDIYESQTATSNAATTIDVTTVNWASSQWVNFYVHILAGTHVGKIRLITANTGTQITFDTLSTGPGNVAFEIVRLAFPVTGTLIYGGTKIKYTAIPTSTTFTVGSAHAGADNAMVTLSPTEYPALPRGNRFTNYLGRIMVGNVRSALARDSGGVLSGFSSGGSIFVSKLLNPFDYGYTATRVAGEGDIIATPYGGGPVTDVLNQEDSAYIVKARYIERLTYSQDVNDFAIRTPLKAEIGSVGKALKASDDIYFITADKRITSIGGVRAKDVTPQTENIGLAVQNFLNNAGVDAVGRGKEIENKLYFPLKSDTSQTHNNILLIYNKADGGYFEGVWELPAFAIDEMDGKFYFAESNSPDVYQMFNGEHADITGLTSLEDRYPIISEVATHYMNLTASKSNLQAMSGLFIEGYIRAGTTVKYNVSKDFESEPFFTLTFAVDSETGLLDGSESSAFLGSNALALHPLAASFGEPDADGRRHFSFRQYFPYTYGNYFSVGYLSDEVDNDIETTRWGLIIKEDPAIKVGRIRNA